MVIRLLPASWCTGGVLAGAGAVHSRCRRGRSPWAPPADRLVPRGPGERTPGGAVRGDLLDPFEDAGEPAVVEDEGFVEAGAFGGVDPGEFAPDQAELGDRVLVGLPARTDRRGGAGI